MVDFNNETTIGTPATEVVKILILQRRNDLFEALEHHRKRAYAGVQSDISIVRARLFSLFLELQATLKRKLGADEYNRIKGVVLENTNEDELIEVIYELNECLDEMKLIRLDNTKTYDATDTEIENKEKGFS